MTAFDSKKAILDYLEKRLMRCSKSDKISMVSTTIYCRNH